MKPTIYNITKKRYNMYWTIADQARMVRIFKQDITPQYASEIAKALDMRKFIVNEMMDPDNAPDSIQQGFREQLKLNEDRIKKMLNLDNTKSHE